MSSKRLPPDQVRELRAMIRDGIPYGQIAEAHGVSKATVSYHARATLTRRRVDTTPTPPVAEQLSGGRYLTDAQVRGILERRRGGDTLDAIANDLGVSRSTVQHHCAQAGLAGGAGTRPRAVDEDLDWQADALCAQTDPEAFFPEKGGSTREAKTMCLRCDVRTPCLQYALDNNEAFGIWGGLSERERRKLIRRAA